MKILSFICLFAFYCVRILSASVNNDSLVINVYLTPYPEKLVVSNGEKIIHVLKVSTGRPGFETKAGKFKVIAKNDTAISSKYHSPMEFALRLGNPYQGINIHQEVVPDYPASHGCVRTHFKSAMMLFDLIPISTVVNILPGPAPSSLDFTEKYTPAFTRNWYESGDVDGGVQVIQTNLVRLNLLSPSQVTGTYDQATMDAVKKYQTAHHLPSDGKAGDSTMQAMLAYKNHGF
eukprot:TRINITY_DN2900_c0_g1_i1.p1 TRINITY_DN2900_c0_g1~~TRINITY_DN2900_c0_g1_i1.p1  ORF type:complete len:233 (-),score=37.01 TRINITY_DN2900_c0_g1_i1:425-1123(-)